MDTMLRMFGYLVGAGILIPGLAPAFLAGYVCAVSAPFWGLYLPLAVVWFIIYQDWVQANLFGVGGDAPEGDEDDPEEDG